MERAGIQVKHAVIDADTLNVRTAIDLSTNNTVVAYFVDIVVESRQ